MDPSILRDYYVIPLGPEYVENISSRSLKKPVTRENWEKLSVWFWIFDDKIDQNSNFAILPSANGFILVYL